MIYDKGYVNEGSKPQASQKREGCLANKLGNPYDAKDVGEIDGALQSNSRLVDSLLLSISILRTRLQPIMKQLPNTDLLHTDGGIARRSYSVPMAEKIETNNLALSNAVESLKSIFEEIDFISQ